MENTQLRFLTEKICQLEMFKLVEIILKYKRVYDPLHPCLSIILQLCILMKIIINLIQSHSISILPSK